MGIAVRCARCRGVGRTRGAVVVAAFWNLLASLTGDDAVAPAPCRACRGLGETVPPGTGIMRCRHGAEWYVVPGVEVGCCLCERPAARGTAAVLLGCLLVAGAVGCEPSRSEKQQREQDKRLDRYYDGEWVRCVNELGPERCRAIQETGMWQCRGWRYGQRSGVDGCAEERFEDRAKALAEQEREAKEAEREQAEVAEEPEESSP